ncbi:GLPGLI family protein [Sphingobacterium oryzagri]|uniref:GLPGLI family protein n=1 Tax=Sphingobacterium oryzagri TaxID=3025669 RepID=A0ABY7WJ56_9SPHI|nr:GLPGLI family protein [Sphingobacterium sp. KACC 22765]WDF69617.1 GLPGLI family protein [Sphingobacterium sp. KACC 22765]
MKTQTKKTTPSFIIYASIFSFILILLSKAVPAQVNSREDGRYIVINYVSTALSPLIVDVLSKQIPDQSERNNVISMIGEQKYYFTLTLDTKTNHSIYHLDSTTLVNGVNSGGNYEFVLKDSDGEIYGKENVAGASHNFAGNISTLQWKITDETRKIGKYNCTKAILNNLNYCAVWFTSEVPIMVGPEIFDGLPGLVIETETAFDQTSIHSIKYTKEIPQILSKIEKYKDEMLKIKTIPIESVFKSKNSMITMMTNQTKSR